MSKLKNKVVWITGASSGIGQALGIAMAKEGAKLVLSSRRKQELNEVAKKCSCEVLILPLDLSDQSNFNSLARQVVDHFGSVDILINNGGISQRSEATSTSLEVDRKLMEINYFGAVALTKAVLPYMQHKKSGHLVAISSLSGKFGFFLRSAYSASKFALVGFYESLRLEEEKNNIKVSLVFPGFVHTNISQNALAGDGQKHAKLDNNQKGGITAEQCANDIIKGINKGKHQIISGGTEKWGILVNRLFPNLFHRILRKKSGE